MFYFGSIAGGRQKGKAEGECESRKEDGAK